MSFYAIYASCNFNRSIYIERNVVMMTKEGSTQIKNFMTSGAGVLAKCKSYSEKTLFL